MKARTLQHAEAASEQLNKGLNLVFSQHEGLGQGYMRTVLDHYSYCRFGALCEVAEKWRLLKVPQNDLRNRIELSVVAREIHVAGPVAFHVLKVSMKQLALAGCWADVVFVAVAVAVAAHLEKSPQVHRGAIKALRND